MINVDMLIDHIRSYNLKSDSETIYRAYVYAKRMHKGQKRYSGQPYIIHPVAVAKIMADQRLDDATIITALLHDVLEDTGSTLEQLTDQFGKEIANLVNGVTKLTNIELYSNEDKEAKNFRKLFLAMSKDLRVMLVKLGDRLHNMRTIRHMNAKKQIKKAQETMDIYAPLAARMGMQGIREELEDLSFQVLKSDARSSILRRFITLRNQNRDLMPQITHDIKQVLQNAAIKGVISGRKKKPYAIWYKMQVKKQSFSHLSDIYGFRIIVDNEENVYRVLGAVHQRWRAVPGRFKDYISQPKSNGYRSIHTTISGRDGKRVEVQIRTKEMHQVAEFGVAAHWTYKDGKRAANRFSGDPVQWLAALNERMKGTQDNEEFIEHVKLEMFEDQVFCFTPKGDVIPLPRHATAIDFAFAIHTRVGLSCSGAKVNGRRVPIWQKLRNGQSVKIQTAHGQNPNDSWMGWARTARARTSIRRSLRKHNQEKYINIGQEMARITFEKIGKKATVKALTLAAKQLGILNKSGKVDKNEMLLRIGKRRLRASKLVEVLYPELLNDGLNTQINHSSGHIITGLQSNQWVELASCCRPLPGERIVGIKKSNNKVQIHVIYCQILESFQNYSDCWIDLAWTDSQVKNNITVTVEVTMANDAAVFGRICTLIGEHHSNITDISFIDKMSDFYRVDITLQIRDIGHLLHITTALEADTDVANIVEKERHKFSVNK